MITVRGFTFQELIDSGLLKEYMKGGKSKEKVIKQLERDLYTKPQEKKEDKKNEKK